MKVGLLLFLLLCCDSLLAQSAVFTFTRIGTDQGLSYNTVHAIFQDSRGYFWFGTEDGLNRYDGYTFTVYKANPANAASLASSGIHTICEDQQGYIWIGTSAGLHRYDPRTDLFRRYAFRKKGKTGPIDYYITDILLRPTGEIWIATHDGLLLFNPQTNKAKAFHNNPENSQSLSHNLVMNLLADGEKGLWIATFGGGLSYHDFQTGLFTNHRHKAHNSNSPSSDKLRGISLDTSGRLWVGTHGEGLNSFDPLSGHWTRYRHDPLNPRSLSDNRIATLQQLPGQPDLLWIGTDEGGLNVLNLNSGTFTNYLHNPADAASLSNNSVYSIYQGKQGRVWLGTEVGINVLDPEITPFSLYQNNALSPGLLNDNFVVSLCADRHGNLWVGTKGAGLSRLDPKSRQSKHYRHEPGQEGSLGDNVIQSLYEDRSGTLWVGTASAGLHRYDSSTDSFIRYKNMELAEHYRYYLNDIHAIFEDTKGRFWLGTHGGLYLFDRKTGTFTSYRHDPDNEQSLSSNVISHITEGKDGNLWIGTFWHGLNRLDPELNHFIRYRHQPKDSASLSDDRICSLHIDARGELWVGTHRGLNRFAAKSNSFESYQEEDGLPDARIYGILEDHEERLWLSTQDGLSVFDLQQKQFRNFTVEDGLQSNSFAGQLNFGAHSKGSDGLLYFGGFNGLNQVDPRKLRYNPHIPPVVLTGLRVHNKPFYSGRAVDQLSSLELSHRENVLEFAFAALDYTQPGKNQYAYKLEGVDQDWVYSGTRRYASYSNLNPGEYVFRVKASNNDGVWNEAGTTIRLHLATPPWKSWWAYLFYASLVLVLVLVFWRYTLVQQRLKHELALERLESEKLLELDQLKSRFFANISHEFRTPLSLILGPLEQLMHKREHHNKRELEHYSLMQRNGQRLLQLINQLLDISKIEAGSMKVQLQDTDLVKELRICVASFASLAESKGIELQFQSEQEQLLASTDSDKLQKILYNLLSNACKFTPAGGSISVWLQGPALAADAPLLPYIEIGVEDSGRGIAAYEQEKIFDRFYQVEGSHTNTTEGTGIGLALTRELVHLLKGQISVSSELGKGSCFKVRLPLLVQQEGMDAAASQTTVARAVPVGTAAGEVTADKDRDSESCTQLKKPLLLIVEDNAELRRFIGDCFAGEYSLQEAADGVEGFELAVQQIPDLIISDLMMPRRNGNELCTLLKEDERTSHIPFILLTAKASTQSRLEGLGLGADDYLTKPFIAEELRVRVKNLIEQRRKLRERFSQTSILQPSAIAVSSADERFIQRALAVVEQHMANEDFSVESFGQEIGMSRMQLHRKLTALTGQSSSEFIRTIRLQRAASLLQQRWGNVADVAYAVGYQNLSYFSKCFKEVYQQTPSEYAASHAADQQVL